jgi:hypothetical protein
MSPSDSHVSTVPFAYFEIARRLTNGDVVVVVDHDEVAELQVTSHRCSLGGDTLHSAAITEEGVCVVVEQLVAGLVEDSGRVPLSNGKTDSVGKTLAEGTSGDLDTGGVMGLRVTRSDRVNLLSTSDFAQLGFLSIVLTRKFFRSSMLTP